MSVSWRSPFVSLVNAVHTHKKYSHIKGIWTGPGGRMVGRFAVGEGWMLFSQCPQSASGAGLPRLSKEFSTEIVDRRRKAARPRPACFTFLSFQRRSAHRYTQVPANRSAVIPAGMQESSAMDGNSPLCKCLIQGTHQPADSPPCDWIPAVHAGMTGFNHLCITASAPCGNACLSPLAPQRTHKERGQVLYFD